MDYKSSVSLAFDSQLGYALVKYFGFSPATRYVSRYSYTEQQWIDLMYNELKNGRPVLYGGVGSGGHEFVIDGYNGNELFHVNWGWDGNYVNYVALSVLNSGQSFPIGGHVSQRRNMPVLELPSSMPSMAAQPRLPSVCCSLRPK